MSYDIIDDVEFESWRCIWCKHPNSGQPRKDIEDPDDAIMLTGLCSKCGNARPELRAGFGSSEMLRQLRGRIRAGEFGDGLGADCDHADSYEPEPGVVVCRVCKTVLNAPSLQGGDSE